MEQQLTPIPVGNEGLQEQWATWQARVDEQDRAARRRLFMLISALILSAAVLSGLRWF
jgi:hypothetical protein